MTDSSFMCDAIPSPPDSADGLPDSPQGGAMSSGGGSPSHLQMNGSIDEFLANRSPSSNNSSIMDSPPHHQHHVSLLSKQLENYTGEIYFQ